MQEKTRNKIETYLNDHCIDQMMLRFRGSDTTCENCKGKNARFLWITAVIFFVTILILINAADSTRGETIQVDAGGGEDYETIQEAIDNATKHDLIMVGPGTYYENVWVNDTRKIIGEASNPPIIDGGGHQDVIKIQGKNVSIANVIVRNSGTDYDEEYSGIRSQGKRTTISNVKVQNCTHGISFKFNQNNTISDSICTDNDIGIFIYYSRGNELSNVTCTGNRMGVRFEYMASEASIHNCHFLNNDHTGLYLKNCAYHSIHNNSMEGNGLYGLALDDSSSTTVKDNRMTHNSAGIYVTGKSNSMVVKWNAIEANTIGLECVGRVGSMFDAKLNWWGDPSGPKHADDNPEGKGNKIIGDIWFNPWIMKEKHFDVSPNRGVDGSNISFSAEFRGDEWILRYAWTSSIDGEFYNGTKNEIFRDDLSRGNHTIQLRVLFKNGTWSEPFFEHLLLERKSTKTESLLYRLWFEIKYGDVGPVPFFVVFIGILLVLAFAGDKGYLRWTSHRNSPEAHKRKEEKKRAKEAKKMGAGKPDEHTAVNPMLDLLNPNHQNMGQQGQNPNQQYPQQNAPTLDQPQHHIPQPSLYQIPLQPLHQIPQSPQHHIPQQPQLNSSVGSQSNQMASHHHQSQTGVSIPIQNQSPPQHPTPQGQYGQSTSPQNQAPQNGGTWSCPRCGVAVGANYSFCLSCGTKKNP